VQENPSEQASKQARTCIWDSLQWRRRKEGIAKCLKCPFTTTLFSSFRKASNSYLMYYWLHLLLNWNSPKWVIDWFIPLPPCVIQSTAAFLHFLVWSNLLPPSCTFLCDPIYCRLLALSCVIQSTAAFLRFLVWSNLLPPSCPIHCCNHMIEGCLRVYYIDTNWPKHNFFYKKKKWKSLTLKNFKSTHTHNKKLVYLKDVSYWPDLINYYIKKKKKKT
jgi:hypothetical protein